MTNRCLNCGHQFEHESGKLRCPSCLRQHGLEPADQAGGAAAAGRARGVGKEAGLSQGLDAADGGGAIHEGVGHGDAHRSRVAHVAADDVEGERLLVEFFL